MFKKYNNNLIKLELSYAALDIFSWTIDSTRVLINPESVVDEVDGSLSLPEVGFHPSVNFILFKLLITLILVIEAV